MIQAIPAVHVLGRKLWRDLNGIFIEDVFKDFRQSSINLWGIHPKIPPAIPKILTCCLGRISWRESPWGGSFADYENRLATTAFRKGARKRLRAQICKGQGMDSREVHAMLRLNSA